MVPFFLSSWGCRQQRHKTMHGKQGETASLALYHIQSLCGNNPMLLSFLILPPGSLILLDMLNTEATTVDQIWFSLPSTTDAAHFSSTPVNTSQGLFIVLTEDSERAQESLVLLTAEAVALQIVSCVWISTKRTAQVWRGQWVFPAVSLPG